MNKKKLINGTRCRPSAGYTRKYRNIGNMGPIWCSEAKFDHVMWLLSDILIGSECLGFYEFLERLRVLSSLSDSCSSQFSQCILFGWFFYVLLVSYYSAKEVEVFLTFMIRHRILSLWVKFPGHPLLDFLSFRSETVHKSRSKDKSSSHQCAPLTDVPETLSI